MHDCYYTSQNCISLERLWLKFYGFKESVNIQHLCTFVSFDLPQCIAPGN